MASADPIIPSQTIARSRIANAVKAGADDAVLAKLRADLRAANIAAFVERTLADAPPLSDDQCERIGMILRGHRDADAELPILVRSHGLPKNTRVVAAPDPRRTVTLGDPL